MLGGGPLIPRNNGITLEVWMQAACFAVGLVMLGLAGLSQGARAGQGRTTDATHAREAGYGLTANRASSARQAGAPLLS